MDGLEWVVVERVARLHPIAIKRGWLFQGDDAAVAIRLMPKMDMGGQRRTTAAAQLATAASLGTSFEYECAKSVIEFFDVEIQRDIEEGDRIEPRGGHPLL